MIHIISVSDGYKHFQKAIDEYIKRLPKKLIIHHIKPTKHTEIPFIKATETEKIIEKLSKLRGYIFLCDEHGKYLSTTDFSNCIQKLYNRSEDIIFVIGGSYGFDISKIQNQFQTSSLKLSSFVMPHGLAFLVLIEQIYRSFEIARWSGYHHK